MNYLKPPKENPKAHSIPMIVHKGIISAIINILEAGMKAKRGRANGAAKQSINHIKIVKILNQTFSSKRSSIEVLTMKVKIFQ